MLNYIHAEFYKLLHRKYTYIALGAFLLLEGLFMAGFAFHNSHSFATPFGGAILLITEMGVIGFLTCMLTGDIVFAAQYKSSTLKNEVSFGLSRAQIYLGKLISQTLLSIAYMVIMLGFFVGGCAVLLPMHGGAGFYSAQDSLIIVGYFLGVAFPLWIGAQAVLCMCQFLVEGEVAWSFLYVGIIFVLDTVLELLALFIGTGKLVGSILMTARAYLPASMLSLANSVVGDPVFFGQAWLVGLFWVALSTAIGLWGFNRKEIK